jgi:CheY-like chemotaxis protein
MNQVLRETPNKMIRPILLVEDNLQDIELTMLALESNNVANPIVTARHGGEALDYLLRRGPHADRPIGNPVVVFLDLKMPKMDGLELLEHIKKDPSLKTIPVVMLTSSREESDLVKTYRLGVNAYVVKPVDFDQFTKAIKQLGIFWGVLNELPPG